MEENSHTEVLIVAKCVSLILIHSFLGGRLGKLKKLVENMVLDCLTMAIG